MSIHEQLLIREIFIRDAFQWLNTLDLGMFIICFVAASLLIFIICMCIEALREVLFRWLGFNKMIQTIKRKIQQYEVKILFYE